MTVADLRKSSGMGSEQDIENHPLLELSEVGSPNAGRVRRAAGAGTVALAVIASAYALHVSLRARAPATTNDTTIAAYTQGVTTSGGFITLGADSSMCLDVQGGQNNVYTYPCVPGNHNQQFSLFRPSETSTAFKVQWMSNTESEQCLGNVNGNLGISLCDAAAELEVPTSGSGPVKLGGQCLKVEGVTPGADMATKNVAWGDCAQAMTFSFTQVPTYMPGTLPSLTDSTQCLVAVGTTVQMGACTSPSANWIYNRDGNPGVIRPATDKTKCITFVQPSSTFELRPCLIQGGAENLWIAQPTGALTLDDSGTCLTPGASTTCVDFQLPVTPTLSPAAPAPAPAPAPGNTPAPAPGVTLSGDTPAADPSNACGMISSPESTPDDAGDVFHSCQDNNAWLLSQGLAELPCRGYGKPEVDPCTLNINNGDWTTVNPQIAQEQGCTYLWLWDEPTTQGWTNARAADEWKNYVDSPGREAQLAAARAAGLQVASPQFHGNPIPAFQEFFNQCGPQCSEPGNKYYIDVLQWNAWLTDDHPHADEENWILSKCRELKQDFGDRKVILGNFAYIGAKTAQAQIDAIRNSILIPPSQSELDAVYYFVSKDIGGGTENQGLREIGDNGETIGHALVTKCQM